MTKLDPASLGLLIMASILILGIGAAGLGMFLADRYRRWRDSRARWRNEMDGRPREHKERWFDWRY